MPIKDLDRRRESKKIYERLHPHEARERCKKYREKDPDRYRRMANLRAAKYREKHRKRHSRSVSDCKRKQLYGIDKETYLQMLQAQKDCCAICGLPESNARFSLAVDHCHNTGKVRSLLCSKCNPGLGMFRDSPELLIAASRYLESHKQVELSSNPSE